MANLRHVLVISPHFPPINAPDHQRIRTSLPYFAENGWTAVVLAVRPNRIAGGIVDPLLEQSVPRSVEVIRVGAIMLRWTRLLDLGSLALRALPYLWLAGHRLLSARRFDLVYFSTTQFPVMILGPNWKRKFGVPYVVDLQDPWFDDYYKRSGTRPPGGHVKYAISKSVAQLFEPKVMRQVTEVISVSPAYVETLLERYSFLRRDQFTVLPFGAPESDFEILPSLKIKQTIFDRSDGKEHWVYIGAAGEIMAESLRLLFSAVRKALDTEPQRWRQVRMHFVGTSYAPMGRAKKTVEPIAIEFGVADIVKESTARIPYFETLQTLVDSDALIIVGSDSPGYSASKVFPYMLVQKPLLAILHEQSPAVEILRRCNAGRVVTFDPMHPGNSCAATSQALEELRRKSEDRGRRAEDGGQEAEVSEQGLDWNEFKQYTAREMTRRQCEVFDRAITNR